MIDIPPNIGIPTKLKPYRCFFCRTPLWRWNGKDWVCFNCKMYKVIYERADLDLSTLDGCVPSGMYKNRRNQW